MSKAYHIVSENIEKYGNNNNSFESVAAFLLYYSNPHEQEAFVNEYYKDLSSLKKSEYIKSLYTDYLNKNAIFNSNINNPKLINALYVYSIYGYNVKNFQLMIKKGMQRLQRKMKNIEKHFKNQIQFRNENHLEHFPFINELKRNIKI